MSVEKLLCPHLKVLPKEQCPQRKGVITLPCKHRTPQYYLGWAIPYDVTYTVYPTDNLPEYWFRHVQTPWAKLYKEKYRNITKGKYCIPDFAYMNLDQLPYPKDLHLVVYIAHNRDEDGLALSENEEFIKVMKEVTKIDESITGELKWIRCL
ncbi:hypothetical protein BT96DRAFT_578394 [Gymnopus androsaceus JB14]|uniref:Uncharacterized protein n=1 Tax=Gymnopus androsaceus JB14 TaxID=1447944 RepID=A0A6A4GJS5_9AGAR|nr:hypothetical protein BT96DRAFT_578394 [Gymnopus androsaceus JB14]